MRWNSGRRTWQAGIIVGAVIAAGGGSATALPSPSCGWIGVRLTNGTAPQLVASHGALACFNRAARDCTAASISDTLMDVAAGTSYVFAVKPGGTSCRVTRLAQGYSASFGLAAPVGPVISAACRRTAVTASGVTLNCGGPDILIPATVTVKSPAVTPW